MGRESLHRGSSKEHDQDRSGMLRLIPPYISEQVSSNAEKRLVRQLRDLADRDCPELSDWVCLHSVNLLEHAYKRMGEIDLLLIGPPGVFVLEIKGGRVSRGDGIWEFTNKFDRVTRKTEGPFDQAKSAIFAIQDSLAGRLSQATLASVTFGYGVVFPDIDFVTDSTEWSREVVLDRKALESGIPASLTRLAKYWTAKEHSAPPRLSVKVISEITDLVRPDFDLPVPDAEFYVLSVGDRYIRTVAAADFPLDFGIVMDLENGS